MTAMSHYWWAMIGGMACGRQSREIPGQCSDLPKPHRPLVDMRFAWEEANNAGSDALTERSEAHREGIGPGKVDTSDFGVVAEAGVRGGARTQGASQMVGD